MLESVVGHDATVDATDRTRTRTRSDGRVPLTMDLEMFRLFEGHDGDVLSDLLALWTWSLRLTCTRPSPDELEVAYFLCQ